MSKPRNGLVHDQVESVPRCNMLDQSDEGLEFWQTRSNSIIIYDPVPANSVEKVANTQTKEILYQKVSLSPRPPPKITLNDTWQVQREFSHQRGASTVRPFADDEIELKIDFRIRGSPQAAVEKEDEWTRGLRRLVHPFKNHPNQDALIADVVLSNSVRLWRWTSMYFKEKGK